MRGVTASRDVGGVMERRKVTADFSAGELRVSRRFISPPNDQTDVGYFQPRFQARHRVCRCECHRIVGDWLVTAACFPPVYL